MEKVRIGLIGLGFMGTTHFGIYSALPDAQIVALAETDPAKRTGDISKVAGNLGNGSGAKLDLSKMRVYDDALKLIADPEVDVVDICIPTPFHADLVVAALNAGKHVFCEKPLCRDRQDISRIVDAVKKSGKYFNLGMCVRAWPEYRHAYEYYTSGKAGKVQSATFKRISPSVAGNGWENWYMVNAMSGGALIDLHTHDTDLIRYFFGRPQKVTAFGARGIVSDNAVDHCIAVYDFGNDALISTEGGWAPAKGAAFEMSFTIVCEKATLKLDSTGYHIYTVSGEVITPEMPTDLPTGWHQELAYFVDCVKRGVAPTKYQNIDEIADSYRILMAELDSIDNHKTEEIKYV